MKALESVFTEDTAGPETTSEVRDVLFNDMKFWSYDFVLRECLSIRGDKERAVYIELC
jgi:hypothetical protein